MADALGNIGKPSGIWGHLELSQIGWILQRLGLSGKRLGSDQAWVAA